MSLLSRREFLGASLASTAALHVGRAPAAAPAAEVAFFLVGDTHYLADKLNPEKLDARSAATNARLIEQLNRLPGTKIPEAAGGGTVAAPRGVIHAGDLIDSGDKNGGITPRMHQTEWAGFNADFGLTGKDGRLKVPVYEVHGNHDSPQGDGLVVKQIVERNKSRPGLVNVARNGLHYAWDWGSVHCINLGISVGAVKEVTRKRRYQPLDSLEFLTADLAEKVGKSGRPVIITHHLDIARNATPPDPEAAASTKEWDPCDVRGYFDALKGYNVAAILFGHTHARDVYHWDGSPRKGKEGIPVFNVDNSGHFGSKQQALFYFHLRDGELTVREFATDDGWATGDWTPQTWKTKVALGKG
ncbi:MAG: metallophosphoesterase [Planctomycetia bacterium]|nr:metallophosphoesterase [Planctomycetia bacterium]